MSYLFLRSSPLLKAKSYKLKAISGFTLIEMLVVITIFTIMTAVIMADFPSFRDKVALDLVAQEIATTIRQAQVYGIGTREAGSGFVSYGIYFDLSSPTNSFGLDNKSFYLYADRNFDSTSLATIAATKGFTPADQTVPNCTTIGSTDCFIEKFAITGAAKIASLKSCDSATPPNCPDQTKLDVFFQRFYPEAEFIGVSPSPSYVQIMIQSTRNASSCRAIEVRTTGQIVVNNNPSPC